MYINTKQCMKDYNEIQNLLFLKNYLILEFYVNSFQMDHSKISIDKQF